MKKVDLQSSLWATKTITKFYAHFIFKNRVEVETLNCFYLLSAFRKGSCTYEWIFFSLKMTERETHMSEMLQNTYMF